MEIVENILKML